MCYYGLELCVPPSYVARYKSIGATVGGCGSNVLRQGVEEASSALQLSLQGFPNPTSSTLTLLVNSSVAGMAEFQVLDVQGRALPQRKQELNMGLTEIEFKLGTLSTGTYLIRGVDALGRQGVVRVNKH